jgi:hypothetical protein
MKKHITLEPADIAGISTDGKLSFTLDTKKAMLSADLVTFGNVVIKNRHGSATVENFTPSHCTSEDVSKVCVNKDDTVNCRSRQDLGDLLEKFIIKHGVDATDLYATKITGDWLSTLEAGTIADGDSIYGLRIHLGAPRTYLTRESAITMNNKERYFWGIEFKEVSKEAYNHLVIHHQLTKLGLL